MTNWLWQQHVIEEALTRASTNMKCASYWNICTSTCAYTCVFTCVPYYMHALSALTVARQVNMHSFMRFLYAAALIFAFLPSTHIQFVIISTLPASCAPIHTCLPAALSSFTVSMLITNCMSAAFFTHCMSWALFTHCMSVALFKHYMSYALLTYCM